METVGSSVGSPLLPNIKKWAAQWAAEWGYPWEFCHANSAAHYFHIWKQWAAQWAANFFQNWIKWAAQWAVEWAAHGNFVTQIRLPTTSIYGYSGQLSGQLSGQPTTNKYGNRGQFGGQPTELPNLKNGSHLWFTCKTFVAHVYVYILHVIVNDLKSIITKQTESTKCILNIVQNDIATSKLIKRHASIIFLYLTIAFAVSEQFQTASKPYLNQF